MNTRSFLHAYAHWSISPAQNGHHVNCGITHIKTPSFKSTRLLAFLVSAVRRVHNDHLLTTWKAEKQNMCTPSSYFMCFPLSTYTKTAALLLLSLICFSTAPQTIWKALKKKQKKKLRIAMHGVDWAVSGEEWLRKHHCWGQTILWNYIVHRTCSISFGSMLCFNPSKRMFVPGRRQKKPLHFGEAVFLHLTWLASKTTLRLIEPLPLFPL